MAKHTDLGPLRDDIASLRGEGPPQRRRDEAAARRRRRPSRAAVWRRRLIAILIVAGLGVAILYVLLDRRSTDFEGRWAGSQGLLGNSTLVIKKEGDSFRVKGLEIDGQGPSDVHVDDGRLYASGESGGRAWTVRFELYADDRQLWAYYESAGQPEQRLRFTRVTD